jgi:hypothetical protein
MKTLFSFLLRTEADMSKPNHLKNRSFKDAPQQKPDDTKEIPIDAPPQKSYDRQVNKKRGLLRYAACG